MNLCRDRSARTHEMDCPTPPLVSVIIIFFNAATFLEEAIGSVFAQTYTHWELLLCDDGSTDGSTILAQRYTAWFPDKVRYLEHAGHKNRGMSATRNLGLRHAEGEYIAWLDADDAWLPQKLLRQVQLMQEHPTAAMVYGPLHVWFSWTNKPEDFRRDFRQDIGVAPNTLIQPPQLLLQFLPNENFLPGGVLVQRAVLDEVGGYEETMEDEFEDEIVHAKICLQWPVLASSEVWYKYRQHEDSYSAITRQGGSMRRRNQLYPRYLGRLADYLCAKGCNKGEVWQLLQEQLRQYRPMLCHTIAAAARHCRETVRRMLQRNLRSTRKLAERVAPPVLRRWIGLRVYGSRHCPPVHWLHFGHFRRTLPLSRVCGQDRGTSVTQYYTETFLQTHAAELRGDVLVIGAERSAWKFGGNNIRQCRVLQTHPGNPQTTLVGDLSTGAGIPAGAFDCILLTQGLSSTWNAKTAVAHAVQALKPGGVMLVTLPGIFQGSTDNLQQPAEYWRFTSSAVKRLFTAHFTPEQLRINVYGNVLTAMALLHGIAAQELHPNELAYGDPDYPVLISVRAVKAEGIA